MLQMKVVSHHARCFSDIEKVHIAGGHCRGSALRAAVNKAYGKSIPQWVQACSLVFRVPQYSSECTHCSSERAHDSVELVLFCRSMILFPVDCALVVL